MGIKCILLSVGVLVLSSNQLIYSENAAKDTGAEVANIVRELQTSVAANNKQLRDAQAESEKSFTQIQQLSPLGSKLEIPKIKTTEDNNRSNSSGNTGKSNVANPELLSTGVQSTDAEGRAKYDALIKQHREMSESIRMDAKNYAELSDSARNKVDQKMKSYVDLSERLNQAPTEFIETSDGRPDFRSMVDDLANQLDTAGRDKLKSIKAYQVSKTPTKQDTESSTSKSDSEQGSENPELAARDSEQVINDLDQEVRETELNGIDLIRSKCSGSVGAKNGAALVKHLTSGDCGDALDSNPDLKAEYNIKRIVQLIASWGFRTASFDAKSNQAIGLTKLPELGLILDYKNPKSEFKAIEYQPAVEVQQSQILSTSDEKASGPLSLIGSGAPRDKASLQHNGRD